MEACFRALPETDEWWCSRLTDGLGSRYTHRLIYLLSNGYGLAAFSRFELIEPSVHFLADDAIPSIKTGVRPRCGAIIDLYGLHHQPPAPLQDSKERDVEFVLVGKERSKSPSARYGFRRCQRRCLVLDVPSLSLHLSPASTTVSTSTWTVCRARRSCEPFWYGLRFKTDDRALTTAPPSRGGSPDNRRRPDILLDWHRPPVSARGTGGASYET
jgi:hypothetical protein